YTRYSRDWSSVVCSADLGLAPGVVEHGRDDRGGDVSGQIHAGGVVGLVERAVAQDPCVDPGAALAGGGLALQAERHRALAQGESAPVAVVGADGGGGGLLLRGGHPVPEAQVAAGDLRGGR